VLFSIEVAPGSSTFIDHWAYERLCHRVGGTPVASPLHQGCGWSTTSALASDSDSRRIVGERVGVSQGPHPCVVTVVNRSRVRVGGSEAVSHRRTHNFKAACNLRAEPIIGCGVPEDQSASVYPQQSTVARSHFGDEKAQPPSRIGVEFQRYPGNRPARQQSKEAVADESQDHCIFRHPKLRHQRAKLRRHAVQVDASHTMQGSATGLNPHSERRVGIR